jgi:hypothetical protein
MSTAHNLSHGRYHCGNDSDIGSGQHGPPNLQAEVDLDEASGATQNMRDMAKLEKEVTEMRSWFPINPSKTCDVTHFSP